MCFCVAALSGHDEVLAKRARHVITEIQRTQEAADALKRCDFKKVWNFTIFRFSIENHRNCSKEIFLIPFFFVFVINIF